MNTTKTHVAVKPETRYVTTLKAGDVDFTDVRSDTFGELVKLATPKVTHYHGDLFWDALWINEHFTKETTDIQFFYVVRDHGTHIGTDEALLRQITGPDKETGYIISVRRQNHRIIFESVQVDSDG